MKLIILRSIGMDSLFKEELNKFWKWENSRSIKINQNLLSEGFKKVEWEDDYPYCGVLLNAIEREIEEYSFTLARDSALMILEAMAIDSESELVLEKVCKNLNDEAKFHLATIGVKFSMWQARWQIAELLLMSDVESKKEILIGMILNDSNKYVQRRTLLSLAEMDPKLAIQYAFEKIKDKDEYLRLVSLRIIVKYDSERLGDAIFLLKGDTSNLIKKELIRMGN